MRPGTSLLLASLPLLAGILGCSREERRFRESPAAARVDVISQSKLHPGKEAPPPIQTSSAYDENAWAVAQGRRYYLWFNCNGCHFNGGGGIGPPLMDDEWIYGREPANVFATIVQGRPNGMPSFRGRINDQQVWQIVAYVRSLSGELSSAVEPGRAQHMEMRPTPQSTEQPAPNPEL